MVIINYITIEILNEYLKSILNLNWKRYIRKKHLFLYLSQLVKFSCVCKEWRKNVVPKLNKLHYSIENSIISNLKPLSKSEFLNNLVLSLNVSSGQLKNNKFLCKILSSVTMDIHCSILPQKPFTDRLVEFNLTTTTSSNRNFDKDKYEDQVNKLIPPTTSNNANNGPVQFKLPSSIEKFTLTTSKTHSHSFIQIVDMLSHTKLSWLSLKNINPISDPSYLCNLQYLTKLKFTRNTPPEDIITILKTCSNISELHLKGINQLESVVNQVAQTPSITYFKVRANSIDPLSIINLINNSRSITKLFIHSSPTSNQNYEILPYIYNTTLQHYYCPLKFIEIYQLWRTPSLLQTIHVLQVKEHFTDEFSKYYFNNVQSLHYKLFFSENTCKNFDFIKEIIEMNPPNLSLLKINTSSLTITPKERAICIEELISCFKKNTNLREFKLSSLVQSSTINCFLELNHPNIVSFECGNMNDWSIYDSVGPIISNTKLTTLSIPIITHPTHLDYNTFLSVIIDILTNNKFLEKITINFWGQPPNSLDKSQLKEFANFLSKEHSRIRHLNLGDTPRSIVTILDSYMISHQSF